MSGQLPILAITTTDRFFRICCVRGRRSDKMPQYCHTSGVVIRVSRGKDVVLTLLTPDLGRIPVIYANAKNDFDSSDLNRE